MSRLTFSADIVLSLEEMFFFSRILLLLFKFNLVFTFTEATFSFHIHSRPSFHIDRCHLRSV